MDSAVATAYSAPELIDSGTTILQPTGSCGALTYTVTSSPGWVIQDSAGSRTFSIQVNEDPTLLGGPYTLSIDVTSVDYPSHIAVKSISVPIEVVCTNPLLVATWTVPATW